MGTAMAQPPNPGASTPRVARRPAGPRWVALLVAPVPALLLAAGCSSSAPTPEVAEVPEQAPIVAPEPLPDTRGVTLAPAPGAPISFPVTVEGGELTITGTVAGPTGPVDGATILLERFIGERSGRLEVTTDATGRFEARGVHGGRYRFRAWRTPDLAMAASELRFVAADATVDLGLAVDRYDGADLTGDLDTTSPEVGGSATVTVLATRQQVDGAGIVTTAPASGRDATVEAVGPWDLDGPAGAVIDDDGRVAWSFTCTDTGSVSAVVSALEQELTLSATCVEPVEEPPPVEPPVPDLDVGESFTPPVAGPIPAGDYLVVDDPGTCSITYQAWTGTAWDPVRRTLTGTGTLTLPEIARDLRTLGDSPPCTYERVS